jgi:hypothetical protein
MGGSSGGGFTSLDLTKITQAANDRIQQAFSETKKLLFVCGSDDLKHLSELISKTDTLKKVEYSTETESNNISEASVSEFSIVVGFVNRSINHEAINKAMQLGSKLKKSCLFTRSTETSPVPQYVLQLRIRTISWHDLIELLKD